MVGGLLGRLFSPQAQAPGSAQAATQGAGALGGLGAALMQMREQNPEAFMALGAGMMQGDMGAGFAGAGQAVAANNRDRRQMDMTREGWNRDDARFAQTFGLQQQEFGLRRQALAQEQARTASVGNATASYLQSVGAAPELVQLAQAGQGAEALKLHQNMSGAGGNYGLQPSYFRDEAGNIVPGQFSDNGTVKLTEIPQGFTAVPPSDLNAERARGTAMGKASGEAMASLPGGLETASSTVRQIDELLTHDGLGAILGPMDQYRPSWTMDGSGRDALARYNQLQGKAFLEAYGMLRGGGAITEVEGNKAQAAMARMERAQDESTFKVALRDFRDAVDAGQKKLLRAAGVPEQNWGAYLGTNAPASGGGQSGVSIRRID